MLLRSSHEAVLASAYEVVSEVVVHVWLALVLGGGYRDAGCFGNQVKGV